MIVGLLTAELYIPASTSLKDKRMVLNSIRDRVRKKFNVSFAEVDFQDKWQRATVAIALVSANRSFADEALQKVFNLLDNDLGCEVLKYNFEYR